MQVVNLDILDVVAIHDIHLPVDGAAFLGFSQSGNRCRPRAGRRLDRRNVDMLDAPLCLELGIYPCRGGGYTPSSVSTTIL